MAPQLAPEQRHVQGIGDPKQPLVDRFLLAQHGLEVLRDPRRQKLLHRVGVRAEAAALRAERHACAVVAVQQDLGA